MRLARNPFYTGRCRGNVEQVVLRFPQDLDLLRISRLPLEQYLRGELDVLTLTDASVHEGDRIRRQFAAEYVSAPWLFTIYLGFVTSRPPFDDVRLRQALALAADREHLANVILRGMFSPGQRRLCPARHAGPLTPDWLPVRSRPGAATPDRRRPCRRRWPSRPGGAVRAAHRSVGHPVPASAVAGNTWASRLRGRWPTGRPSADGCSMILPICSSWRAFADWPDPSTFWPPNTSASALVGQARPMRNWSRRPGTCWTRKRGSNSCARRTRCWCTRRRSSRSFTAASTYWSSPGSAAFRSRP